MFRRWRRRARLEAEATPIATAPATHPSAADLRGEHIFELLNAKLAEFIGANGQWALVRRTPADTDRIFDAVVTHQIAAELTRAILDERESVAVVVPKGEDTMALSWNPSPLNLWAEPVTVERAPEPDAIGEDVAEAEDADAEWPSTEASGETVAAVPVDATVLDPAPAEARAA